MVDKIINGSIISKRSSCSDSCASVSNMPKSTLHQGWKEWEEILSPFDKINKEEEEDEEDDDDDYACFATKACCFRWCWHLQ